MLAPGLAPEPELLDPHPAAAIARDATSAAISSLNENRIHLFIREPVTGWQVTRIGEARAALTKPLKVEPRPIFESQPNRAHAIVVEQLIHDWSA